MIESKEKDKSIYRETKFYLWVLWPRRVLCLLECWRLSILATLHVLNTS